MKTFMNFTIFFALFLSISVAQEAAKIKPAQSMSVQRAYHEGIYIPVEGSYMVCGGINGNNYLDSCELFTLSNLSWSAGPKMKVARKNPPLANIFALSKQGSEKGSILIIGGEESSGQPLVKTDFYDIQTKSIDQFKPLPAAHSQGIAFFNPTDEPLILIVMIGPGTHITKLVIANQDINWVAPAVQLNYSRDGHRFTPIPDYKILVVGGGSKTLEIYNYKDDKVDISKDMISDRKGHQIINLSDSSVLIAGGVDENGNIIGKTEIYNPISNTLINTGDMNIPRKDFRLTLLHNNNVLASGGIDKDGKVISTLELFDPLTGKWTTDLNLITARANHTAELIGSEGVLMCGGNTGEGSASIKTCEIYSPEKICTPGTFSCDGDWVVKCNSFGDGTNRTNQCPGGCKDGQCIGGCTEGERRCRDIGVKIIVEMCNATGGWVLFEQCEESCKDGYCDGQVPPKDAGVDIEKDIIAKDTIFNDENVPEDIFNEDITGFSDIEILSDISVSDTSVSKEIENKDTSSNGCSCNFID